MVQPKLPDMALIAMMSLLNPQPEQPKYERLSPEPVTDSRKRRLAKAAKR